MPTETIRTACPLDCYDTCTLLATVTDGVMTAVRGDPDHPVTQGFACRKAQLQLERQYAPDRLTTPLRRRGDELVPISWDDAIAEIAERLAWIRRESGPLAVLAFANAGSMGSLKYLDRRFWNLYGGVTTMIGSLCLAAGAGAQRDDCGASLMNDPADIVNARRIILWGRNPAWTNVHLVPLLRIARARGAHITLIDPLRTASAPLADEWISIRPGTDGALALGMANVIISEGLVDRAYADAHVHGYTEFAAHVAAYPPDAVAALTDVPAETIVRLAREYATGGPAMILPGYGLQRYTNSGHTVRAIDALAALTGNIGRSGGGVSYANDYPSEQLADMSLGGPHVARRTAVRVELAQALAELKDPPVRMLWTARANPLAGLPDVGRAARAFASIEFHVAVDFTLTDTCRAADIVLPCATPYESEDVNTSYWHNYLTWCVPAVPPRPGCWSDLEIFAALADKLGFGREFAGGDVAPAALPGHLLRQLLAPLADAGVDLDALRGHTVRVPGAPVIAWEDGRFATPSGKFELWSQAAAARGEAPLPTYTEPAEMPKRHGRKYPFQLLTPQWRESLHTQFFDRYAKPGEMPVHIAPTAAAAHSIADGDRVVVRSPRGAITGVATLDDAVRPDTILIYSGGHTHDGNNANVLTAARRTDLGNGAAYYDCVCSVTKAEAGSNGGNSENTQVVRDTAGPDEAVGADLA